MFLTTVMIIDDGKKGKKGSMTKDQATRVNGGW